MKRRLLKFAIPLMALMMCMAFASCGESTSLEIICDENFDINITAENASEDMTGSAGTFTVSEGDDVIIEPNFEEGTVLIQFFPIAGSDENADIEELLAEGEPTFDIEISGKEPVECGFAAGDYLVVVTVVEKANGTAVISVAGEDESDAWTEVSSAKEAAEGAGNMDEFDVPSQLKINDLTFTDPVFSYQDGVAQAYYESGAIGISVRKACGIYGGPMTDRDLESFTQKWTQQTGDEAVDCFGMEKDSAIVIQWGDEEEFYTVTSQGLGGEEYGMDATTVKWLEEEID